MAEAVSATTRVPFECRILANFPQNCGAVHFRHPDVEQHQIGPSLAYLRDGVASVCRLDDRTEQLGQTFAHQLRASRVVVGDEQIQTGAHGPAHGMSGVMVAMGHVAAAKSLGEQSFYRKPG